MSTGERARSGGRPCETKFQTMLNGCYLWKKGREEGGERATKRVLREKGRAGGRKGRVMDVCAPSLMTAWTAA